jgi:pyruvate dehydrogenase E2 component (dihydrolipoamide acetyltransferase)
MNQNRTMITDITLPALAPSMLEGTLARWLKKPGETVEAGEQIAEIETDKALVELEAAVGGVLTEILVAQGTANVKVDTVIARVRASGAAAPDTAPAAPAPASAALAAPAAPAAVAPIATRPAGAPAKPALRAEMARVVASPIARRLAGGHGIDLSALKGTGPNGRIVRADVEMVMQRNARDEPATAASPPAAAVPAGAAYDEIPHTSMRRVIAQRLSESKREVPHFYLKAECQVDALLALRKQVNEDQPDGAKISVNDLIVKAVGHALRRVPDANASWTENAIRRWHSVDISVAVATPGGLITPVVREVDRKSLGVVASEIRSLAQRARDGRLRPEEYQGGGFTISNLGMYGVSEFSAIINPPQACILAVGAAQQQPVVCEGELAVATVLRLTLSVDHRVVDGAVGAQFLAALKSALEKPWAMLV